MGSKSLGVDLSAQVRFIWADDIDPFYYEDEGRKVWRLEGIYPDILTEKEVLEHLAYNALVNGVTDASSLEGWGDLERGMLTIHIFSAEVN